MRQFGLWLGICLLTAGAAMLLAAHLPTPMKKLGLFSAGWGALLALLLWQCKQAANLPRWRGETFGIGLLAGAVELGRLLEGFRLTQAHRSRQLAREMNQSLGLGQLLHEQFQQQIQFTWLEYLHLRYTPLLGSTPAATPSWLPHLLCSLEVLLAILGGALCWWWLSRNQPDSDSGGAP